MSIPIICDLMHSVNMPDACVDGSAVMPKLLINTQRLSVFFTRITYMHDPNISADTLNSVLASSMLWTNKLQHL